MKLAILGTKPYYESDRILYEALKRGHEAIFLPKGDIVQTTFFNNGKFGIFFKVPTPSKQVQEMDRFSDKKPLQIKPSKTLSPMIEKKGFIGKKKQIMKDIFDISYFDAILIREMGRTLEWTSILANHFASMSDKKVLVEQKIGQQMFYRSKHGTFFKTSTSGFSYPKSLAVTSKRALKPMLDQIMYPVIVKKSVSSKGKGVYKCNSAAEVLELIESEGLNLPELLIQEMIDYSGDIRVFVVGEKILGAMRREPQAGQWKGNVAQGAKAYPVELTPEQEKLALDVVKMQNSEISGVDLMVPKSGAFVIETNRSPQFKGFESSTGQNVGEEIVKYIEDRYKEKN